MTTRSADPIAPAVALGPRPPDTVSAEVRETAERLGVAKHLEQVVDLTREIYGRFTDVSVSVDPEFDDDIHIVFRVPVNGSIEEALDLDDEWGRRMMKIIPRSPQVYLTSPDFPT